MIRLQSVFLHQSYKRQGNYWLSQNECPDLIQNETPVRYFLWKSCKVVLYRNEAVIANTIHNTRWYSFFLDVSVIYLYAVVSDRKGNIMLQKLYVFFRKETVLSIAVILALLSMFWVRPDKAYYLWDGALRYVRIF